MLLLGTSSSGMISLLLDLLLDILNEMLSLTLKSILPTPIECGNIEKQISILWLAQMMGCQQALSEYD